MQFRDPTIDLPLLQELQAAGVISQADWNSWPKPEEGSLLDVIRDHAAKIDGKRWSFWLTHRHSFLRVRALEPDWDYTQQIQAPARVERLSRQFGCFPVRGRGQLAYVASALPIPTAPLSDLREALGVGKILFFALTPDEIQQWFTHNPALLS